MNSPSEFSVVSTFSGVGGSSLGYEMAGGKVELAVEWDSHAAECYRLNFPDTPLRRGDIADLSVDEVFQRTGLEAGELDILDGSPPCQGFSTSGRRMLDDPRNGLFREYVRLLEGLKPRTFVMENVSGLVKGKMKLLFAEILRTLRNVGYRVSARLLNAKWYGVPQSRERLIFIGVRENLEIKPSHPKPASRPISAGEAIEGLPVDKAKTLGGMGYFIWCRAKPMQRWDEIHPKGHWFNSRTLDPARPAPTIISTASGQGRSTVAHWRYPRCLNIAEVKRLCSFPDDFQLTGGVWEKWARLGNSVPPSLMRAVAEHLRDQILAPELSTA